MVSAWKRAGLAAFAHAAQWTGRLARSEADLHSRVPCLVAVAWHWTPPEERDAFASQVDALAERFRVLDRAGLDAFYAGAPPTDRPALLLTFDDGNRNAFEVAAPILEARGLRGWFFVIAGASDRELPPEIGGAHRRLLMGPAEWRDLASRGHVVGSHSWSHANLGKATGERLRREVVASRAAIEAATRLPADSFAYPLGGARSFSVESQRLVSATYRYVFHSCPAASRPEERKYGIGRYVLSPDLGTETVRYLASGLRDRRYAARLAKFRAVCNEAASLGSKPAASP